MNDNITNKTDTISGSHQTLKLGMWAAWASFILFVIYDADVFVGGAFNGIFNEPFLTLAKSLTIIGAFILVVLMAAIHVCFPKC